MYVVCKLLSLCLNDFVSAGARYLLDVVFQASEWCLCPSRKSRVVDSRAEFRRGHIRSAIFLSLFKLGYASRWALELGIVHGLIEPLGRYPVVGCLISVRLWNLARLLLLSLPKLRFWNLNRSMVLSLDAILVESNTKPHLLSIKDRVFLFLLLVGKLLVPVHHSSLRQFIGDKVIAHFRFLFCY